MRTAMKGIELKIRDIRKLKDLLNCEREVKYHHKTAVELQSSNFFNLILIILTILIRILRYLIR